MHTYFLDNGGRPPIVVVPDDHVFEYNMGLYVPREVVEGVHFQAKVYLYDLQVRPMVYGRNLDIIVYNKIRHEALPAYSQNTMK